jgi:hypothetical protein
VPTRNLTENKPECCNYRSARRFATIYPRFIEPP